MVTISQLNQADAAKAYRLIEPLIERASNVAEQVVQARPFADVQHLIETVNAALSALSDADQLTLFRAHPELAPENPLAMTTASQTEQARLELLSKHSAYQDRLTQLNIAYQRRFGFPFIIALVGHASMQTVLVEFERRVKRAPDLERAEALHQVSLVSAARAKIAFGCDRQTKLQASAGE